MIDEKSMKTQSLAEEELQTKQKYLEEKKEQAKRLLKGGIPTNEAKAVLLLEDCVTLGDVDAMLMLAKCCALGYGIEKNAERAEELITESATKGNREAQILSQFIKNLKGQEIVDLECLLVCFLSMLNT